MNQKNFETFMDFFKIHVKDFDTPDPLVRQNIDLKYHHTLRVLENTEMIAQDLSMDENDRLLAGTIALFHDIGRFTQFKRYRTFQDRLSVDHAALGVEILQREGVLSQLPDDEIEVVQSAIACHNQFRLPKGLSPRTRRHAQVIRDADKLDIFKVVIDYHRGAGHSRNPAMEEGLPDTGEINPIIIEDILNDRNTHSKCVKSLNDTRLFKVTWIFDINFEVTRQAIRERGCIDKLLETLPDTEDIKRVRQHLAGRWL